MHWPRVSKRIKRVAILLCALIAMLFYLVATSGGRTLLVKTGLQLVSSNSLAITAKGLTSNSWFDWRIAELTVSKQSQPWLVLTHVSLTTGAKGLTEKKVTISNISAATLDYYNVEPTETSHTEISKPPFLETNTWQVIVSNIYAGRITIHHPRNPPPFSIHANLAITAHNRSVELRAEVNTLNDNPLTASLNAVSSAQTLSLTGNINEMPGGYFGELIRWPATQPLTSNFDVSIKNSADTTAIDINSFDIALNKHAIKINALLEIFNKATAIRISRSRLDVDGNINTLKLAYTPSATEQFLQLEAEFKQFPLGLLTPWIGPLKSGQVTGHTKFSGDISSLSRAAVSPAMSTAELLHSFENFETTLALTSSVNWQNEKFNIDGGLDLNAKTVRDLFVISASRANITRLEFGQNIQIISPQKSVQYSRDNPVTIQFFGSTDFTTGKSELEANINSNNGELSTVLAKMLNGIKLSESSLSIGAKGNIYDWISLKWNATQFNSKGSASGTYQELPIELDFATNGLANQISVQKASLSALDAHLNVRGTISLENNSCNLDATLSKVDIHRIQQITELEPYLTESLRSIDGSFSAGASISGLLTDPTFAVNLQSSLSYGDIGSGDLEASGVWAHKKLSLHTFNFHEQRNGSKLKVSGDLFFDTRVPATDISIEASNISGQWLSLIGWPDSYGKTEASLTIKAPGTDKISRGWLSHINANGRVVYDSRYTSGRELYAIHNITDVTTNTSLRVNSTFYSGNDVVGVFSIETPTQEATKLLDSMVALPKTIITSDLKLSELNFLLPKGETIGGQLAASLVIEGNIDNPQLNGQLVIENGTYNNEAKNIDLTNINIGAKAQNTLLEISSISAVDSEKGTIAAKGFLNWKDLTSAEALNMDVTLRNSNIVRDERLHGKVSGDLTLKGSNKKLTLGGALQLSPFYISLASVASTSVPHIEVEFKSDIDVNADTQANIHSTHLPKLWLDLIIVVSEQAYVEGRGLYSELDGKVLLAGPINAVDYRGSVKTVRGTFDIFGRRFALKHGNLDFSNSTIAIAVNGLYKGKDIEISVDASGTTDKLNLTFSSVPELPQDEIIAHLIFGHSIKEISAIQALQLAAAIKTLQGQKSRFDLMGNARDILGVNTLTIETSENADGEKGLAIGAGKYLTDNVYIEVEHTSNSTTPWLGTITIELTPSITLESTSGSSDAGATSKLIWKRDY